MAEMSAEDIEKYVENILRALELENNEEKKKDEDSVHLKAKTLEKQGQALRSLVVTSCNIAPYGIVLIHFGNSDKKNFKSHSVNVGDKVVVTAMSGSLLTSESGIPGCVELVKDKEIAVAFDDIQAFESAANNLFQLVKLADDVTYNRMKNAVKRLLHFPIETETLTKLLFGSEKLEQVPLPPAILNYKSELTFLNDTLQPAQKEAIKFALKQKNFGIIHGPPGTGKTTTLVELIYQLVKSGEKVLVCAPSNVAVDNIMIKLQMYLLKAVRLGHPARVCEENRAMTVNAHFDASFPAQALKDAKAELQKTIEKLVLSKSSKKDRAAQHSLIRKLRAEIHQRENKMASETLLGVDVCFATLGSSYRENILRYFPKNFFSTVVIDEASQGLEAACWMAVPYAKRCILAGDHHQLSPMILSQEAAQLGLGTTLMERAIEKLGKDSFLLLTHQFRMNSKIMDWVSQEMYGGQLTADTSAANHLLKDIIGVEETEETTTPLLMVDTSGCGLHEHCYHLSYGNSGEADLVAHMANLVVNAGVVQQSIAIITPYNRQVDLIRESLSNLGITEIEVKTVDGFQGGEREAVILSLVRSNARGELGFITDRRRINVAVSRARRLLCVVADSSTVGKDSTVSSLIHHIRKNGQMRSAHELCNDVISSISKSLDAEEKSAPKKRRNKTKKSKEIESDEPVTFKNFKEKLQQFIASNETTLVIETKLTGFQGLKIVAEVERLKLEYEVVGDPDQERIRVKKEPAQMGAPNEHVKSAAGKSARDSEMLSSNKQNECFKLQLQQFVASDETVLSFQSNLSAFQRACIHEEAEKLGLEHGSVGDAENRKIVVSKRKMKRLDDPDAKPNLVTSSTDNESFKLMLQQFLSSDETIFAFPPNLSTAQLSYIHKEAGLLGLEHTTVGGARNMQIVVGKLKLEKQEESLDEEEIAETLSNVMLQGPAEVVEAKDVPTRRINKKKNKQPLPVIENPAVDDSDAFLDELAKLSGQCASANCKVGVRLIGHDCPHCKQRYCIPHTLPEVHGCALDAKKAARKAFVHPKPKSLTAEKRKALEKSLKSKMSAKSEMRTNTKK